MQGKQAAHGHLPCVKAAMTRKALLSQRLLELGFAAKSGGNTLKNNPGSSSTMEEGQGTICCRTSQRFIICRGL